MEGLILPLYLTTSMLNDIHVEADRGALYKIDKQQHVMVSKKRTIAPYSRVNIVDKTILIRGFYEKK